MKPFHGVIAKKQKLKYIILAASFFVFLIFAVLAGYLPSLKEGESGGWFWPALIMVIYFLGAFILNM